MHVMRSSAGVDELVTLMYEAAQEPTLLPSAVSAVARRFRAHLGGLRIFDAGHASYRYFASEGMTPEEWDRFDESCSDCNIWRHQGFHDLLADGVGHSETILPHREFVKTRFYNEFAKNIDVEYGMGLCLWSGSAGQMVSLSLNRGAGANAFAAAELDLARNLLPHFRSAYAIMRRLSWAESRAASLAASIDRLHAGLILVDANARSLYRNQSADAAIASRRGLSLSRDGAVHCAHPAEQKQLLDAIRESARGELAVPRRIHVRDGEVAFVLVVSMLRGELAGIGAPSQPCASVFVHVPSSQPVAADPASALREAFGFTTAESRLAACLVAGMSPAACADALRVSVATVRTHLRSLFAKTSTQRQSQLIAVLHAILRTP